jgi:ABC-type multidrug transport system permease subunit
MKRGGRIIYFGPLGHESHDVIEYFSKVEGVEPIAEGLNPATWMLNVTTPSVEAASGVDFGDLYANSDLAKRNVDMVEQLSKPGPGDELLRFEHRYARSFFEQFRVLLWKLNQVYWRSPTYNLVRFAMTILIALVSSSIFWQKGMDRGTQGGVFNVAGVLYAVVLFLGVQNTSTVQPVFAIERTVMYREQAAGMYSSLPFALAIGAVEIPYILLQTVIYSVITYSMIGFEWTGAKFGWYVLVMFLTLVYFTLYGIAVIALTPSLQVGAILSSTFYSLWNLFAGFLLPRPAMPGWWLWYWYLNPVSWTLYGLIGSQLGDVEDTIQLEGNQGTVQVGQYVDEYFGYSYSFLGQTIAILVSFCLVFWLATAAGLKFLNYRKR